MKSLTELASNPELRAQWETLLKSEVHQSILAGIENIFGAQIPAPSECNGQFPAIMLGVNIAQQVILRAIRNPEQFNIRGPSAKQHLIDLRNQLKKMGYPDTMLTDEALAELFATLNVDTGNETA